MKKLITIFALLSVAGFAQVYNPFTHKLDFTGGTGSKNPNNFSAGAVTSLAINIASLGITDTNSIVVQCWSGTTTRTLVTGVTLTSISTSSVTANFSSTANVFCTANANGGVGPVGAQGQQGAQGIQGAASTVPGPTGPVGPAGSTGPAGTNGTNGSNGSTGAAGTTGPVGPTGATGPKGDKGDTGTGGGGSGPTCDTGNVLSSALTSASSSQEITIKTAMPGSTRYDLAMVSETTQFTGTTGLTVSMGRPGTTTHDEITGATVPLMVSSGDANFWSTKPGPPQLSSTYNIVLNFAVTSGNVNAATAGSLKWELCSYTGGTSGGGTLTLSSLTNTQLASLTNTQLGSLTN